MVVSSADLEDGADNRPCADAKAAADPSCRISESAISVLRKGASLSHTVVGERRCRTDIGLVPFILSAGRGKQHEAGAADPWHLSRA